MKIFCVGRNYVAHAEELGNEVPDEPVIFMKPKSALLQPHTPFYYPEFTNELHYECELVLRIDHRLSKATDPAQALQAVGAVTLGLDLTLRDLQDDLKTKGQPWERAKAFDGSCVLADWIAVSDVVQDWDDVHYSFHVNDELRQAGNTAHLIFDIGTLLADISQVFTLEAGDVVMTGTPAGVAALQAGEQLKMTLKGKNQDYSWNTFVQA